MSGVSRRAILFFSTGFYSGYAPFAPGTFGTAVAVPLYALIVRLHPALSLAITCAVIAAAFPLSELTERYLGRKDPPQVVIDEIAGYLVTMLSFPPDWRYLAAGFVVFRIMDIVKPYPADRINRSVRGGPGIVLDDIVAGIYANLILQALRLCGM